MTEKQQASKKGFSADWLMRGALFRIGDTFDRLTGRKWVPSSSLATSELIVRIKDLLDKEAKEIPGKGKVVPHNIDLKMQWDKFSTDSDDMVKRLENELLIAAADHINDNLYFTFAPLDLRVKPDYFIDGVKLFVGFEKFSDKEEPSVEMNVTVPSINLRETIVDDAVPFTEKLESYVARFEIKGAAREKRFQIQAGGRVSVGRTGTNDLVIDDISVSKIHAALVARSDHQLSVADTGSKNGTYIDGQRIAYGKAIDLGAGGSVKFGDIEVRFEYVAPQKEADESAPIVEADNISDSKTIAVGDFTFRSRKSSPDVAAVPLLDPNLDTLETPKPAETSAKKPEAPPTE